MSSRLPTQEREPGGSMKVLLVHQSRWPWGRTMAASSLPGAEMATFLAYLEPVPRRLYPLVATLQELARRGHRTVVRSGAGEVGLLRSVGIDAGLLAPELAQFESQDWRARTRFGALMRTLNLFGERARPQAADLRQAIGAEQPDAVILDETSWGAAAAAERSGPPVGVFGCVPGADPVPGHAAVWPGPGAPPRHHRPPA